MFQPLGGVGNYIRKRRLHRSFLEITSASRRHRYIGEIAYGLGFGNESNFSRMFRQAYGMTPKEAREAPASAWAHMHRETVGSRNEPLLAQWLREISR